MVDVLGGALPRELLVLAQYGWQLQLLQMMTQQDPGRLGRGGHAGASAPAPANRLMQLAADVVSTVASGR